MSPEWGTIESRLSNTPSKYYSFLVTILPDENESMRLIALNRDEVALNLKFAGEHDGHLGKNLIHSLVDNLSV
jgi:hypothetical protein